MIFLSTEVLVYGTPPTVFEGFNEIFQLLFPLPEDDHILSRSCSANFYQSYGPFTIFQSHVLSLQLFLHFLWIFMIPFSYCSHDLKEIY